MVATSSTRCGSPWYSRKPCSNNASGKPIARHKANAANALTALCWPRILSASAGIKRLIVTGSSATLSFLRRFPSPSSAATATVSHCMPFSLTKPKQFACSGSFAPKLLMGAKGDAMCITRASSRFNTRIVLAPKMRALSAAYASMLPCQSRWSCVTFRTVATSACKLCVVCSWKLDSSRTHACGNVSCSSASRSTSSAAGLILPATCTVSPARLHSKPVRLVTVVLPLVPVIAMSLGA